MSWIRSQPRWWRRRSISRTPPTAGRISNANCHGLTYTRDFARVSDDYAVNLSYISAGTANGLDASGNPIMGFKWWDFTYPTLVTSGSGAIPAFVAATNGGVNFGGSVGAVHGLGRECGHLGRRGEPGRLVAAQRDPHADAGAARRRDHRLLRQHLRHERAGWCAAGDGRREHHEPVGDARVPDRPHQWRGDGQPD